MEMLRPRESLSPSPLSLLRRRTCPGRRAGPIWRKPFSDSMPHPRGGTSLIAWCVSRRCGFYGWRRRRPLICMARGLVLGPGSVGNCSVLWRSRRELEIADLKISTCTRPWAAGSEDKKLEPIRAEKQAQGRPAAQPCPHLGATQTRFGPITARNPDDLQGGGPGTWRSWDCDMTPIGRPPSRPVQSSHDNVRKHQNPHFTRPETVQRGAQLAIPSPSLETNDSGRTRCSMGLEPDLDVQPSEDSRAAADSGG